MDPVYSFPYRIGGYQPEYTKTAEAQAAWLAKRLPKARKFIVDGVDTFFYRAGPKHLTLFVHVQNQLLYVMELHKMAVNLGAGLPHQLSRRVNFQGSVWRDAKMLDIHLNFPKMLFQKLLLSPSRNVVSDSQQSDRGEAFWQFMMASYLKTPGFSVYGLDCEAKNGLLVIEKAEKLRSMAEFDSFYTSGTDLSGYYKRLALVKD